MPSLISRLRGEGASHLRDVHLTMLCRLRGARASHLRDVCLCSPARQPGRAKVACAATGPGHLRDAEDEDVGMTCVVTCRGILAMLP